MVTDVNVREADAADAPVLAHLRWAFKQEDHGGDLTEPVRPMKHAEDWIQDRLASKRWLAWVAESDGKICGHVFLHLVERMPEPYDDNTPVGYVTNFYVVPERRNRGFGAALLQALRRHAKDSGMDVLIVWPSEGSVPLYRRSGFQSPTELLEAR
ncbi:GNAT family N-acetyltransferase [Streptomyces caniferus]|uniref:GNAT family N-acetyltransferase n=1 Tax=Streptomyces caniferus TaxID=285557 RepID=UPI0037FE37B7